MGGSLKIIFHPQVAIEYFESFRWYESQQEGLGLRFESLVESGIKKIQENPEWFSYGKKPYREVVIVGFPYVLVYKYNSKKQEVYVVSLFHTKRSVKAKYRR